MREGDLSDILVLKWDVYRLAVAGCTVALNAECSRAVMAGAAGLALLHILHGRWVGAALSGEYIRMALRTVELLIMHRMREGDLADIFIGKGNINRLAVTTAAVALDAEGS